MGATSVGRGERSSSADDGFVLDTGRWLMKLRWATFAAQVTLLIGADVLFDLPVDRGLAGVCVVAQFVANTTSWRRATEAPASRRLGWLGGLLLLDMATLTGLLLATGGPYNPFMVFYLVHVLVAALVLDTRWIGVLAAAAVVGMGALYLSWSQADALALAPVADPSGLACLPVDAVQRHVAPAVPRLDTTSGGYRASMAIALAFAAVLIGSFAALLRGEVTRQRRSMQRERDRRASERRYDALVALSAGAAHEIANPLATIAVAAGELVEVGRQPGADPAILEEAEAIRAAVTRAREVLDGMALEFGGGRGESLEPVEVGAYLREVVAGRAAVSLSVDPALEARSVRLPVRSMRRALRDVLDNAGRASERVEVEALLADGGRGWSIAVRDEGPGFPQAWLDRAFEPFHSVRDGAPGRGLGLFAARRLAVSLGGDVEVRNRDPRGAEVRFVLPMGSSTEGGMG